MELESLRRLIPQLLEKLFKKMLRGFRKLKLLRIMFWSKQTKQTAK